MIHRAIIRRSGAVFRAAAALLLASAAAQSPAQSGNSQPVATEQLFTADQARADFRDLYAGLKEAQYDINAHVPATELDRAFAAELAALDRPMSRFELQNRFQRFVARVKIAHTRIPFPADAYEHYLQGGGTVFPLDVRIDDGRVFVTGNRSGLPDPAPGDEITALDGRPTATWLKQLAAQVSADTPYLAYSIVEYRLPGYLWIDHGRRETFALTVRKPDGRVRRLSVPGRTAAQLAEAGKQQPPAFALDDKRTAKMLPGGIAYLRPGPFYNIDPGGNDWDNKSFVAFIDAAFKGFITADARILLIDLRNNPGGDSSFSDPMIAWFATRPFSFVSDFRIRVSRQTIASNRKRLDAAAAAGVTDAVSPKFAALYAAAPPGGIVPYAVAAVSPRAGERFTGKVNVLIDRYSYSNTVNVAAIVQDYGFGTILGEETTDLATTYGAMESFDLPRTRIPVGYAKALLIRPNGSRDARGVVPDIPIATPVVLKHDVVLERALSAMGAGRK
jgi:hypothetical protein